MWHSIEFRVLLRSIDQPWVSAELARFPGVEGECLAYRYAADFGDFENATVDVVCSQCW